MNDSIQRLARASTTSGPTIPSNVARNGSNLQWWQPSADFNPLRKCLGHRFKIWNSFQKTTCDYKYHFWRKLDGKTFLTTCFAFLEALFAQLLDVLSFWNFHSLNVINSELTENYHYSRLVGGFNPWKNVWDWIISPSRGDHEKYSKPSPWRHPQPKGYGLAWWLPFSDRLDLTETIGSWIITPLYPPIPDHLTVG